jgi:hypothetical protein
VYLICAAANDDDECGKIIWNYIDTTVFLEN